MKYEVIIENSAERDLLEILTYISERDRRKFCVIDSI